MRVSPRDRHVSGGDSDRLQLDQRHTHTTHSHTTHTHTPPHTHQSGGDSDRLRRYPSCLARNAGCVSVFVCVCVRACVSVSSVRLCILSVRLCANVQSVRLRAHGLSLCERQCVCTVSLPANVLSVSQRAYGLSLCERQCVCVAPQNLHIYVCARVPNLSILVCAIPLKLDMCVFVIPLNLDVCYASQARDVCVQHWAAVGFWSRRTCQLSPPSQRPICRLAATGSSHGTCHTTGSSITPLGACPLLACHKAIVRSAATGSPQLTTGSPLFFTSVAHHSPLVSLSLWLTTGSPLSFSFL